MMQSEGKDHLDLAYDLMRTKVDQTNKKTNDSQRKSYKEEQYRDIRALQLALVVITTLVILLGMFLTQSLLILLAMPIPILIAVWWFVTRRNTNAIRDKQLQEFEKSREQND